VDYLNCKLVASYKQVSIATQKYDFEVAGNKFYKLLHRLYYFEIKPLPLTLLVHFYFITRTHTRHAK